MIPGRRRPPPPAVGGLTATGPRPENQDRWAAGPGWAVVCDGVGGHLGGSTAAETALGVAVARLAPLRPRRAPDAEAALAEIAVAANAAVVHGREAGPDVADMATTLTAAVAVPQRRARRGRPTPGSRRWVVVQVGDSPAWRVGPTAARSITWDHNLVGDLVRTGAIGPDDAIGHRGRNIVTRALGVGPTVEPELFVVDLDPDEALVLASDGLSDVAGPDAAVPVCATAPDVDAVARDLVALALDRDTHDNVTVVVAR